MSSCQVNLKVKDEQKNNIPIYICGWWAKYFSVSFSLSLFVVFAPPNLTGTLFNLKSLIKLLSQFGKI